MAVLPIVGRDNFYWGKPISSFGVFLSSLAATLENVTVVAKRTCVVVSHVTGEGIFHRSICRDLIFLL